MTGAGRAAGAGRRPAPAAAIARRIGGCLLALPLVACGVAGSDEQASLPSTTEAPAAKFAPAAEAAAPDRYELRLIRGSASYRGAIRLDSIAGAGYPSLVAVAYRLGSDGEPRAMKPVERCESSIRCAGRGSSGTPAYQLALDSGSFAALAPGEGGVEVVALSKAFPSDVVVTVTLSVDGQPPIARTIGYSARM